MEDRQRTQSTGSSGRNSNDPTNGSSTSTNGQPNRPCNKIASTMATNTNGQPNRPFNEIASTTSATQIPQIPSVPPASRPPPPPPPPPPQRHIVRQRSLPKKKKFMAMAALAAEEFAEDPSPADLHRQNICHTDTSTEVRPASAASLSDSASQQPAKPSMAAQPTSMTDFNSSSIAIKARNSNNNTSSNNNGSGAANASSRQTATSPSALTASTSTIAATAEHVPPKKKAKSSTPSLSAATTTSATSRPSNRMSSSPRNAHKSPSKLSAVELAAAKLEAMAAARSSSSSAAVTKSIASNRTPTSVAAKKKRGKKRPRSREAEVIAPAKSQPHNINNGQPPNPTNIQPTPKSSIIGHPKPAQKTHSQPKKKRKRHSPFRVRKGCVVALRYRSDGNHIRIVSANGNTNGAGSSLDNNASAAPTPSHTELWADPVPGRDDGWALVGKRIRCVLPKSAFATTAASSTHKDAAAPSNKQHHRAMEGEVAALLDRPRDGTGTLVSLLVDRDVAHSFAFLPRDPIVGGGEEEGQHNAGGNTKLELERKIRGTNKVAVLIRLADLVAEEKRPGTIDTNDAASSIPTARWALRKLILLPEATNAMDSKGAGNGNASGAHTSTKKGKGADNTKTRYVGDGNDSAAQQQQNWRWLISSSTNSPAPAPKQDAELFVGEVMEVIPSAGSIPKSLALVTVKRMWLPEHTIDGRQAHHLPMELFHDAAAPSGALMFEVPIEELIILGRGVDQVQREERSSSTPDDLQHFTAALSYKSADRSFVGPSGDVSSSASCLHLSAEDISSDGCSICSRSCTENAICCKKCLRVTHSECFLWENALRKGSIARSNSADIFHSIGNAIIDGTRVKCRSCRDKKKQKRLRIDNTGGDIAGKSGDCFQNLIRLFASRNPLDFDLPSDISGLDSIVIASKPITTKPTKRRKRPPRGGRSTPRNKPSLSSDIGSTGTSPCPSPRNSGLVGQLSLKRPTEEAEEFKVFKPTCSRLLVYDPTKKDSSHISIDAMEDLNSRIDISRRGEDNDASTGSAPAPAEKSNSRATRASQRRMLKDVQSFGSSNHFGVDTLSGRDKEQSIRFGRSGIHAWGVFADEDIKSGDMIVEYRGVLISNRVAEKREREYEKAKIGSDYMFRIDEETVCDATFQGNVARFINASCDPNCETKIITTDGRKRIVIYAKKDIPKGTELVYDYKFPIEYDEKKRIKCYCGSKNCRGFMNWDSRFVVIPTAESKEEVNGNEANPGISKIE